MLNAHALQRFFLFVLFLYTLVLAACASHQTTPTPTGNFLQNYSQLEKGLEGEPGLIYRKPGVTLRAYHKIIIDPVVLKLNKSIEETGLDKEKAVELPAFFTASLRNALAPSMELVTKPAPGVLRLRVGITDIVPVSRISNTLTSVHVLLLVSAASRYTAGDHIGVSSVAAEIEITNAENNDVLLAWVDRRSGEKGLFSSTESDARAAIVLWSQQIAQAITGTKDG